MKRIVLAAATVMLVALIGGAARAPAGNLSKYDGASWYGKYLAVSGQEATTCTSNSGSVGQISFGSNVDASHECGSQSETSIAINPADTDNVIAGSNEIQRLPMRAMYSTDGGQTFTGVDLPLPPARTNNGFDFGSDPGLAFDSDGNAYYSYIVVFFGKGGGINGTEMAVAHSTDRGASWHATFFNPQTGSGQFNDKPMIAVDTNPTSPFRDSVYVAWDNASFKNGKSSANNALLISRSTDGGKTFSAPIAANTLTGGPSSVIGADPFVGPNGEVYVAWHDVQNNRLVVNSSFDGGATFGRPTTIAPTTVPFAATIAPQASRGALLYPACGSDQSAGSHRGTLYCSWMDETASNGTDIFVARSTDQGQTWSGPVRVNDDPPGVVKDQFNQWLSVDPVTGTIDLSWNDARNDPADTKTDIYASDSTNGGASFASNVRVTTAVSDESAANPFADSGNQYGDYEGVAAYGGIAHPIWTDGRFDASIDPATGQRIGEEVFTATASGP
jgi:hypothetical protein